ncbi:GEVED domain-containing protein [uncultured Draconibacterium sp.]|uniref:GEVED domain-containing protein n=1 Tax=uncultured Draconibacterium sp. TaxID=1573823 RepID=UPI002AA77D7A|nr:GEVED domain-containing protein [uncultured Draconibacterium sp.]
MSLLVLFSLFVSLAFPKLTVAQTTIWSEDFESYQDNTGIDGTGNIGDYPGLVSKWTLDVSNCTLSNNRDYFKVTSGRFEGRDLDGVGLFLSEQISISGYTNISITIDIPQSANNDDPDYILYEYRVDGGSWTVFETNGQIFNDITTNGVQASQTGLNGTFLWIRVSISNNGGQERYSFDNLLVQGSSTTPPLCSTPLAPVDNETGVAADAILNWNSISNATGYYIYFGSDAGATNIENGTDLGNVTTYTPSANLNFLTDYYWRIVPYNSYGNATGCSTWSFTTGDISYCTASSTSYDLYESITNVDFAGINNSSPVSKTAGYTDYTVSVTPAEVVQGQNYSIGITEEFLADAYGGYCKVYIDFDRNGDFDEVSELVFGSTYNGNQTMTGAVSIPLSASVGVTRMRVVIEGDGDNTGALPCGAFTWGEVEDYSVNINSFCSIVAQNIVGGGNYCAGESGVEIGLDGSETGVEYQLYRDGITPVGTAIAGDGNAISFGFQTMAGTYTVVGHNISEDCDLQMTGNVIVSINPLPSLTGAEQDETICAGVQATINLSGLVPSTSFSLDYTIDGVPQTQETGLTADGSGNSTFLTPVLDENDDGKTLQITGITITSSTPNCVQAFTQDVILNVQPTSIDVTINTNPSGLVCPGSTVTYTAIAYNGGANPVYQWKVNGINVGANSDNYSYIPSDGDIVSCVMVSDAICATGSATVPVTSFSWDDNSKTILQADYGLNASSGSGLFVAGGIAGSTALAPTPNPSRTDINLTFNSTPQLNLESIDFSVAYQPGENSADLLNWGSLLTISGGNSYEVAYTVVDDLGVSTIQTSGSIVNPRVDYPGFHDYRFVYNPFDGYGRLFIDGTQIWVSPSATPGQLLDISGAGDLIIGNEMDASGSGIPTLDNLSISEILQNAVSDSITVAIADLPSVAAIAPIDAVCAGESINPTAPAVSDNGLPVTDQGWQLGGDVITIPYTVSHADDGKILQYYATNSCGTSYSNTETITVNPRPSTPTASSNSPVCDGSTIQLSTPTVAGASYYWTGPSGFSSTDQNPVLTANFYSNSGTYSVTITVDGCTSEAVTTEVVIDPISVGGWISFVNPICEGDAATLILNGNTGDVTGWQRRLNSGTWEDVAGTSTTLTDTPPSGGDWEYRAVVQSGTCTEAYSSTQTVTVNPELTITLGSDPEICQNTTTTSLSYSEITGSPDGWRLEFDATAVAAKFSSPQSSSLAAAPGTIPINVPFDVAAGVYNGVLTVFTNYPACSSIDYPVTITVTESVPASVVIAGNNEVCAGTEVTYTATPTNGGTSPSFQWKVNGINDGTDSDSFTYTPIDGDVISCEMTSSSTCASGSPATSNSIVMTINPLPSATITLDNGPVCEGDDVEFTITGTSGATLIYNLNGATNVTISLSGGSNFITVNSATENQTLNLISVDNGSCTNILTETKTVVVNPLPATGDIIPD